MDCKASEHGGVAGTSLWALLGRCHLGEGVSRWSADPDTIIMASGLTTCPEDRDKLDQRQGQRFITLHPHSLLDFSVLCTVASRSLSPCLFWHLSAQQRRHPLPPPLPSWACQGLEPVDAYCAPSSMC